MEAFTSFGLSAYVSQIWDVLAQALRESELPHAFLSFPGNTESSGNAQGTAQQWELEPKELPAEQALQDLC